MTTSATPHLFWITSRAAGIVALVLASLAVSLGLLMSTKLLRKRGPDLLALHEVLSISSIVAIVVHGVALLGDHTLNLSVIDIAVPFASSYMTFWTSLGILAGWGTAILGLSYYARRWIGAKRWRSLHRLTALVWIAGVAHTLGEGTDAGQIWLLAMLAIVAIPALILLATRYLTEEASPPSTAGTRREVRDVPVGVVPAIPSPPPRPAGEPLWSRGPALPRQRGAQPGRRPGARVRSTD